MIATIVDAAREYIGTPFHHQGRMRGVGVDCVGLVVCAARDAGWRVEDTTVYARDPDGASLVAALSAQMEPVDGGWLPGDVLTFWVTRRDLPQHVGIYAGETMIHAPIGRNVCEHRLAPRMLAKLHSVWRLV